MKTAEEVAEKIRCWISDQCVPETNDDIQSQTDYIAQVLTAFSEERVKEALQAEESKFKVRLILQRTTDLGDRFADGLEAAKVAKGLRDELQDSTEFNAGMFKACCIIEERLRARKEKP